MIDAEHQGVGFRRSRRDQSVARSVRLPHLERARAAAQRRRDVDVTSLSVFARGTLMNWTTPRCCIAWRTNKTITLECATVTTNAAAIMHGGLPLPPRSRPNASGASETSVTSNGSGRAVPERVDISVLEVMKDDLPEGRVSDVDGDVEVEGVVVPNELHRIG